jgi:CubicO group peptidase (beta-lactamase class C family)
MSRFLLLTLFLAASQARALPGRDALARSIDALVAPFADYKAFSGVVLVAKGDEVLAERASGMASFELAVPNRPDTRFRIASITKRFTLLVLLQLVAEKRLSMDDSLAKFAPSFPKGDRITISQLVHHRSGIRDPERLRRTIPSSVTAAEVVDLLAKEPLGSEPGETYSYTTANYAVLSFVIEKVTGLRFSEAVRRRVYGPAGMKDAGDIETVSVVPRLASGYMPDPFSERGVAVCGPEDTSWKTGGGSGYATARDLHRFLRALFAGKLAPKGTKPVDVFPTRKVLGRDAFTSSGGFPGASAAAIYFPEDELTVVALSNSYAPLAGVVAERAAALAFGENPPASAPKPALPGALDPRLAGLFELEGFPHPFTIEMRYGRPLVVWNAARQSALLRTGENEFFMPLDWATVTFRFGEGGAVEGTFVSPWSEKPLKVSRPAASPTPP